MDSVSDYKHNLSKHTHTHTRLCLLPLQRQKLNRRMQCFENMFYPVLSPFHLAGGDGVNKAIIYYNPYIFLKICDPKMKGKPL